MPIASKIRKNVSELNRFLIAEKLMGCGFIVFGFVERLLHLSFRG
jgi:hypothetical protein